MSILDRSRNNSSSWTSVGKCYEITKKPRSTDVKSFSLIPFAAMEAIPQSGGYDPVYELKEPQNIASGTYFERGDLLVAKITPSFENGKQAWIRSLPLLFGYASTEVIPLRPRNSRSDPRLLFFYLLHPEIRSYVADRMEGSTGRQRVPENVLLELPFPIFSTNEQSTIANALELIQLAIANEVATGTCIKHLMQATMRQLFTCGLRSQAHKETEIGPIPLHWEIDHVGAHHSVISGGTPARGNPTFWTGGTIPWVKTTEVNYCVINKTGEQITAEGLAASAAKLLPAGTLLLAMYGQGVTRGRVAILGIEAACNQACAAITPKDDTVVPKFLYHFLVWRYEAIRELAHGGQQQNLNLEIVRDLKIAYPLDPIEQQEIVEILDTLDQKIMLHKKKKSVLDELFRTLLNNLMTGELSVDDLDLSALTYDESQAQIEAGVRS